jgi:conjugal transfer pilus assembly protein TrbC
MKYAFPALGPALALTSLASAALFAAASAQDSSPGLDVESIRQRSAQAADEAEALAAQALKRAKALAEEAHTTSSDGKENGQRYAREAVRNLPETSESDEAFDFDRLVADTGDIGRDAFGERPRLIAFASTAIPKQALHTLIADVSRAGGIVVFRGFPGGSAASFTRALGELASGGDALANAGIDPRLFRAFEVKAVPTFVVAASDFELCDGFDCTGLVPPHDRMSGNVSVAHVLETFAGGNGPGALIAAEHLKRLAGEQP